MKVTIKKVKKLDLSGFNFYACYKLRHIVSSATYEETYNVTLPQKLKNFIDTTINNLKRGQIVLITHSN